MRSRHFLIGFLASVFLFGKLFLLGANPVNMLVFRLTPGTYLRILVAFFLCLVILVLLLIFASRKFPEYYHKLSLGLLLISFYNLIDYFLFSIVDNTVRWKLFSALIGAAYLPIAIWTGIRFGSSRVTSKLCIILLLPCLLICFYAIPRDFCMPSLKREYHLRNKPPVHLIICDSLSWDVFFKNGNVDPTFKNFHELASQAHVCINVRSTGVKTEEALCQVITGNRYDESRLESTRWLVSTPGSSRFEPIPANETIFRDAVDAGYNNVIVGYYLPYSATFQSLLTRSYVIQPNSIYREAFQTMPRLVLFPGYIHHSESFEQAFVYYLRQVTNAPSNTFFYSHLNLPHHPYPYDEDGNLIGRVEHYKDLLLRGGRDSELLERYRNSIYYLDNKIAELIQLLKRKGRFNNSLIIVTSDTNWNGYTPSKVPLLVKSPNQKRSIAHDEELDMRHLRKFLQNYFRSQNVNINLFNIDHSNKNGNYNSKNCPEHENTYPSTG